MESTFIKIKKGGRQKTPGSNALNLSGPNQLTNKNDQKRWFVFLLAFLLLVAVGWLIYLFYFQPPSPYQSLIPANPTGIIYFHISAVKDGALKIKEQPGQWLPFNWAAEKWPLVLEKTNLKTEEILAPFEDETVLVVLTPKEMSINWLLIARKKISDQNFNDLTQQTETNLKQSFNVITELYRQTKVSQIKSLNQDQNSLFYAQIKNFFLLSNQPETIKSTIDKIIH